MRDQLGFDPTASGFVFRYRHFPSKEWTLYGIGLGTATSSDIPNLEHLSVVGPAERNESIKRLEVACEALGNLDQTTMPNDPTTELAKGASLRGDAFIDIAVNRQKHWFVISILAN